MKNNLQAGFMSLPKSKKQCKTLSPVRKIRRKPRPVARHAGHIKGQGEVRTPAPGADGFLNHTFIPLCKRANKLPEQSQTETDFFRSAAELCRLHGITQTDVEGLSYPYNVLVTHRDIQNRLNRQPCETEVHIVKSRRDKKVALMSKQVFETRHTLYYIPVIPLYRFMRDKENKSCGQLLLAVMSYLYRVAAIPYYRDEDNVISNEYEYVKEYYLECRENYGEEEFEEDITDILKNETIGDIMHRRIYNRYHLDHFAEAIERFKPRNTWKWTA